MSTPLSIPVVATTDIYPARFVTYDAAANKSVKESNDGDKLMFGVSSEATKNAPQTGGSSLAAESGDMIRVHGWGEDCLLKIGAGGCAAGDWLKPDNSGQGVTAAATATVGAIALEAAAVGELCHVLVVPPMYMT